MATEANTNNGCSHSDCPEEETNYQDTVGRSYCSKEHLLADSNGKPLDEDGSVIEDGTSTLPSETGDDITAAIPTFSCEYCTNESHRVAREDSEWVHHSCGMPVPDYIADYANELLENGDVDRGFVEHDSNRVGQLITPQVKAQNADE